MTGLNRAVVLDMVGQALDETWIDVATAVEVLCEYGHVGHDRAVAMLCGLDQAPASEFGEQDDDWRPLRRDDDGTWT